MIDVLLITFLIFGVLGVLFWFYKILSQSLKAIIEEDD